jgi:hypothetical protein
MLYLRMFFGNPCVFSFPIFASPFVHPSPPVNAYFVAFFGGDAAVLSNSQLSTTSYQLLRVSPQAAQNDDPCRIVILSDEPERRISLMPSTVNISSRINTYVKVLRNSSAMNTYAMLGLGSPSE